MTAPKLISSIPDVQVMIRFAECRSQNRTAQHNLEQHCLSIYLSIYLWLYSPLLGLGRFFSFFTFYIVIRTP
jgi:hypothetical protein